MGRTGNHPPLFKDEDGLRPKTETHRRLYFKDAVSSAAGMSSCRWSNCCFAGRGRAGKVG